MAISDVPVDEGETSSGGATGLTPALTSGPATNGNLLVAGAAVDAGVTGFNTPTGWTKHVQHEAADISGVIYTKISDGSESDIGITWGNSRSSSAWILEFSATDIDTGEAVVSAEDESNITTAVTSQASGTTASIPVNDSLSIAFFASDQMVTVFDGRSYSAGYTERIQVGSSSSTRPGSMVATKVETTSGTKSCTFTTTDTGDEMYGCIVVFSGTSGGGTSPLVLYTSPGLSVTNP